MCRALVSRPAPEINLRLFSEEGVYWRLLPYAAVSIYMLWYFADNLCDWRLLHNETVA